MYMHCFGCEKLLNKDFNLCATCHMDGKYKVFHKMHPFNDRHQSILNHTGNKTLLRRARCPCKNGKECHYCSYCTGEILSDDTCVSLHIPIIDVLITVSTDCFPPQDVLAGVINGLSFIIDS